MLNVSRRAVDANEKGQKLAAEGKLEEALAAFNEAVLASPGYAAGWLNRAQVLERLGRNGEAQADREAVRSLATTLESQSSQPAAQGAAGPWAAPAPPRTQYDYSEQDVVGPGRYILNFFLAGILGLVITFFLRNHGWLATWISIAILAISLAIFVASGPDAWGPAFQNSSR